MTKRLRAVRCLILSLAALLVHWPKDYNNIMLVKKTTNAAQQHIFLLCYFITQTQWPLCGTSWQCYELSSQHAYTSLTSYRCRTHLDDAVPDDLGVAIWRRHDQVVDPFREDVITGDSFNNNIANNSNNYFDAQQ